MNTNDEELISAYLDGELNAAETAEVEQLLADSADARTLVDELRGLRDSLRALPRYQVDAGFAARVLERATRAKASASGSTAQSGGNHAARQTAQPIRPAPAAGGKSTDPFAASGRRRGLIWAGLAIAAAALVMLYGGPRQDPELARNEPHDSGAATTSDEAKPSAMVATQRPGERVTGQAAARERAADDAGLNALAEEQLSHDEIADATAAGKATAALEYKAELARPNQPKKRADGNGPLADMPAEAMPFDDTEDAGQPVDRYAELAKAKDIARAVAPAELREQREKRAEEEAGPSSLARKEISAQAVNHGIAVFDYTASDTDGNVEAVNRQVRQQLSDTVQQEARPDGKPRVAAADALARAASRNSDLLEAAKETTKSAAGVELVYAIEGTDQQIAAVLNRLQAQPEAFRLVAVDRRLSAALGKSLHGSFRVGDKGLVPSVQRRRTRNEAVESDEPFGTFDDADAASSRDLQQALKTAAGRRASPSKNSLGGDAGASRPATGNRSPLADAAEASDGAQRPRPTPEPGSKQDADAPTPSDGGALQGGGTAAAAGEGGPLGKTVRSRADLPAADSEATKPSIAAAAAAPNGRGNEKQRKKVQGSAAEDERTAPQPQAEVGQFAQQPDKLRDGRADAAGEKKSVQHAQSLHRILLVIRVGGAADLADPAAETGLKALGSGDAPAASIEESRE